MISAHGFQSRPKKMLQFKNKKKISDFPSGALLNLHCLLMMLCSGTYNKIKFIDPGFE